jgi:hypothetical protein
MRVRAAYFDGVRSQQDIESDTSLSALLQLLDPKRLHDPDHGAALPKEWWGTSRTAGCPA